MFCKLDGYTFQAKCKPVVLARIASCFRANRATRVRFSAHFKRCHPPQPNKTNRAFERAQAKARVVRALQENPNWRDVAKANDVNYFTARRAILCAGQEHKQRDGLRQASVKMTVE
ncbi:hypothetical protein F441_14359, partial [Phytophthora nicotianae CJ01A1]